MTWLNYPRSLVIDLFCLHRKFLVYNLVQRNLKLKYRQSALGLLWTLLIPAASAFVYYLVFQHVMRISIPHYLLFIISGVWPWAFFSTALSNGLESIVGNQALINKVPLPLHVFPFAETLTGFINLLLGLPVLAIVFAITGAPWSWALLTIPIYLALIFIHAYFLSLALSVAYVFFRDLRHALGITIQLWFYATPILYTSDMIPEKGRFVLWLNPLTFIFEGLHQALIFGQVLPLDRQLGLTLWTLVICVTGLVFSRFNRSSLIEVL